MSIEFRCPQCGKLLRTDDDTAGKQAQCPECNAIVPIPVPGSFPGANQAESGNPYQSPQPFAPLPRNQPQGEIAPTVLDLGDIFQCTWDLFKEEWGKCLVGCAVVLVLNLVISVAVVLVASLTGHVLFGGRSHDLFVQLGNFLSNLATLWVNIGGAIYFLKIARGQPAELNDLFSGGPYYVRILISTVLYALMVYVGLILCVVPGVILALMFCQFYYLIIDRGLPVFEAFGRAKEVAQGNKLTLFLIWLLLGAIVLVAVIPCGLGLLVAAPFAALLFPVIYLRITGQPVASPMGAGQSPFGRTV